MKSQNLLTYISFFITSNLSHLLLLVQYPLNTKKSCNLKAKWVLNYNGSTYTMAEGNAEQYLPAGTYKFYAFSDKVSFADGKIVKSLTNASENALYFEGDYILCVR